MCVCILSLGFLVLIWYNSWYVLQIPALLEKADNSETDSDDDDDGGSSEDSDSGCKEYVHPKDKPAEISVDKKVRWSGIVSFFPPLPLWHKKIQT